MSSNVKTVAFDDSQLRAYNQNLKQKYAVEKNEIEARGQNEIVDTVAQSQKKISEMRNAYEVQISAEAEHLDERLASIRQNNQKRIDEERQKNDIEYEKLRLANQKRIDEYRKNADVKLEEVRREYQEAMAQTHEQAKRQMKKNELKEV